MLPAFALTSSCKASFMNHFKYCIAGAMCHITCSCKHGHIRQLKKHIGPNTVPCADLPLVDPEGPTKTEPVISYFRPDSSLATICRLSNGYNARIFHWMTQHENTQIS